MKSFLPVDDGKNIPTRRVKEVAISADTYRPKFSMDPPTPTAQMRGQKRKTCVRVGECSMKEGYAKTLKLELY